MKVEETTKKLTSYLSFTLNDEEFATNVGSVMSILEMPKITKLPNAPTYMRGIINLRGEVLPVIDIHYKFGLPEAKITSGTCILVMEATVEGQYIRFGILVDAVNEVHEIEPSKIAPTPTLGSKYRSDFLEGIYQNNDSFIMIVDIENVLMADEVAILSTAIPEVIPDEVDQQTIK
jgi:purine-binding chemotaxis protein CheW